MIHSEVKGRGTSTYFINLRSGHRETHGKNTVNRVYRNTILIETCGSSLFLSYPTPGYRGLTITMRRKSLLITLLLFRSLSTHHLRSIV